MDGFASSIQLTDNKDMEAKRLNHCAYICDYHLVIVTKYRHEFLNKGVFAYLKIKITEIRKYYPILEIKETNHDKDHIHLLISIPPTMSIGKVVGLIKSNTSTSMKKKFPFLKQIYYGTDGIWSAGYFVSTIGINEQAIRRYIEMQGQLDTGQAKLEFN